MEEKKVTKPLKAKMKVEKIEKDEPKQKLTYEQLNKACAQLYQQNQALTAQIKQMDLTNMFKRLDYLFKVIENMTAFKKPFVESCAIEIEAALTVEEEKKEE